MFKAADMERVRLRQELIRQGHADPLWPEPYCEDSYEAALGFLYEMRTFNEANKRVAPILPKEYLAWMVWHWFDTRSTGQPLALWKSRRILISWAMRGLELWDAGLAMSSTQIGAATYEGVAGSERFIWRVQHLYEQLRIHRPGWNLAQCKPAYNPTVREVRTLMLPNGSEFVAINAEKESFRGSGTTRAVAEELSGYRSVNGVWGQMLIVCQGEPGEVGGHAVAIANTSTNTEWLKLKAKSHVLPSWPTPPKGCEAWETADGVRVLKIHYSADPEKGPEWVAGAKVGVPADEWASEMELDETIEDGLPVFPSFFEASHVPVRFKTEKIPLIPGSWYVASLDCGQTLNPAGVLKQITPKGKQIQCLLELCMAGTAMSTFMPTFLDMIMLHYPEILNQIFWVGDGTVTTRSGTDARSAQDEARRHGVTILPMPNAFQTRRDAGEWELQRVLDDNVAGMLVCELLCPTLTAALRGKYKYKVSASADVSGPGMVLLKPDKNWYSNVGDAWAYGSIYIRDILEGKRGGAKKVTQTLFKRKKEGRFNDAMSRYED